MSWTPRDGRRVLHAPRPLRFAVALLPLGLYSVAGTHDAHAFSRAAFAAGTSLIVKGTDVSTVPRLLRVPVAD